MLSTNKLFGNTQHKLDLNSEEFNHREQRGKVGDELELILKILDNKNDSQSIKLQKCLMQFYSTTTN